MDLTCALCPRTDSAYICREHLTPLTRALDLAFAVLNSREVETTVARLDRMPERGGVSLPLNNAPNEPWTSADGALRPTALPVNLDAAARADAAVNELTGWARHIARERGIHLGPAGDRRPIHGPACQGRWVDHPDGRMWQQCQHPTCTAIRHGRRPALVPAAVACRFLAVNAEWLRWRPEAIEAWPAIEAAARTLTRLVDSPPEMRIVGACTCGTDTQPVALYAHAGRDVATCRNCGARWDVEASRDTLRAHAADMLMTAAECATLAAIGGDGDRRRAAKTITMWAQRGRIAAKGQRAGVPVYRFGDVYQRMSGAQAA